MNNPSSMLYLIYALDIQFSVENQGYPYISYLWPSHYCKDSQITSLKLFLIVTHFVNFKQIFPKKLNFFQKEIKLFKEKSLKMQPFSSELPFHINDCMVNN